MYWGPSGMMIKKSTIAVNWIAASKSSNSRSLTAGLLSARTGLSLST
jgi:hypothetical protein